MKYVSQSMGPVLSVPDPDEPWKEKLIANPFLSKASRIGSFEEYCRGHFHDTYLAEIRRMAADRTLPVGKFSRIVPEPDDIYVSEICIMSIQFGMEEFMLSPDTDLHPEYPPGYPFVINMRACIKASIRVSETWQDGQVSDVLTQWFHVDGHVTFFGNDHNEFSPVDSAAVFDKELPPLKNPMDEYLNLFIGNNDLDRISYRVLSEVYPEALEKPMRVDARKFAQRLQLTIKPAKLSNDHSRFGQIVMRDCWLELDGTPTYVPARTILLDREACRKKRSGRTSGTIFHECDHYILQRPFFEAQRLYNKELTCLCCDVSTEPDKTTALYWIEWQAEHLVPHLMIPEKVAKGFIDQERNNLKRRYPDAAEETIFLKLIPSVAERFYTSKQSTGIRLRKLGYAGADTAYPVNENPASDHTPYDSGVQRTIWQVPYTTENTTEENSSGLIFKLSADEAARAVKEDAQLRQLLETGGYVFTEGRFCLNKPECIFYDIHNVPHLTDYALLFTEECCLPFRRRKQYSQYSPGVFHSDEITGTEIVYAGNAETHKKTIKQAYSTSYAVIEELPGSVGGTLKEHMKRLGVTVEDLEALSHVSQTVIKSIRANNCSELELRYFIAVCLGLKLEPAYSFDLIRKTRYRFDASRESTMYLILLTSMYFAGIDACNEEMVKNKMKPLTKKARNQID